MLPTYNNIVIMNLCLGVLNIINLEIVNIP
jgi:hypothetical protein